VCCYEYFIDFLYRELLVIAQPERSSTDSLLSSDSLPGLIYFHVQHVKGARIDDQVHLLEIESQRVQESFSAQLAQRLRARLNKQHKRELENHEISLLLMRAVLRHRKEGQQVRDGEISELKPMGETLIGQVKGKGKVSDPTPEASVAGGGKPPPLPPPQGWAAGAAGGGGRGDPDDEGEGSGRRPDESRKGRWDKRPGPQTDDG